MSKIIEKARKFATHHHGAIDQRRKYTNEKYIVHPAAVAKLVTFVGGTPNMIAAAWLHDTVEDVPTVTIEEIYSEFGKTIGIYVAGLTEVAKSEDGNRATRLIINNEHTSKQCSAVKTIKLADCYNNVSDIMRQDKKFAITYMQEKRVLLPYLAEGDKTLFKMLSELLKMDVK